MALEEKGIPSVRLGKKLADTIMDAGFKHMAEFEKFRLDRGLPAIGSAEGRKTLDILNAMVPESKQYRTFADTPEFTKVEIEQTKKDLKLSDDKKPTPKQRKQVGDRIIKKVTEISDDADVFFGEKMSNAKKKFIEESIKKANLLIDDIAKFGFRSLVPFLALSGIPGFIVSAIAEVATAKGLNEGEGELFESESIGDQVMKNLDFSGPSASSMLLEQMSQDATMKAGGGMMNINNMIRPVGFANGGDTIVPKQKPMSDDAKLKMFMAEMEGSKGPGEPKGIEKLIADVFPIDPRFTAKQKIKKILGMTQETGGGLMEDVGDLSTLTKRLLLKKSLVDYGGRDALQKMDDLDKMSPVEIEIEFQKLMGVEE